MGPWDKQLRRSRRSCTGCCLPGLHAVRFPPPTNEQKVFSARPASTSFANTPGEGSCCSRFYCAPNNLDISVYPDILFCVMQEALRLCKALTQPARLRILALLGKGERCVCDLVEVLGMPQSTVSRHLAVLRNAGWVSERRQGVWMYYRIADDGPDLQRTLQKSILDHLAEQPQIKRDRAALDRHLREKGNSC